MNIYNAKIERKDNDYNTTIVYSSLRIEVQKKSTMQKNDIAEFVDSGMYTVFMPGDCTDIKIGDSIYFTDEFQNNIQLDVHTQPEMIYIGRNTIEFTAKKV